MPRYKTRKPRAPCLDVFAAAGVHGMSATLRQVAVTKEIFTGNQTHLGRDLKSGLAGDVLVELMARGREGDVHGRKFVIEEMHGIEGAGSERAIAEKAVEQMLAGEPVLVNVEIGRIDAVKAEIRKVLAEKLEKGELSGTVAGEKVDGVTFGRKKAESMADTIMQGSLRAGEMSQAEFNAPVSRFSEVGANKNSTGVELDCHRTGSGRG